jgi:hypothetical protein
VNDWYSNVSKQYQRPITSNKQFGGAAPTPTTPNNITPRFNPEIGKQFGGAAPTPTTPNNITPRFNPEIGKQLGNVKSPTQTSSSTWSSSSGGAAPNYSYTKSEKDKFPKLAKAGDPTNNPAFTGAGSSVSDNNMGAEQMSLGFDKAALNPVVKRAMKKTIPSMKKALVPAPAHACPSCKGEVVIIGRSGNIEHGLCKGCGESPHRTIQEQNAAAQPSSGLGAVGNVSNGPTVLETNASAQPKSGLGAVKKDQSGQTIQNENKSALPKEGLGKAELEKVTPPGEEKLVHKLKDEYGHDKAGKEKAYATAWSIHNKMTKAALPAVIRNAMKKDELEVAKGTVGEKANPEASLPPKDPKAPKKNGNGDTNSDNKGIVKGKALEKKSIAAQEAEKAKEKAEKEAQNPAKIVPKDLNEKLKEKQKEAGQVQKAEGIPAAPTAPKPSGMTIPKIAPRSITKPISTLPPQVSKL